MHRAIWKLHSEHLSLLRDKLVNRLSCLFFSKADSTAGNPNSIVDSSLLFGTVTVLLAFSSWFDVLFSGTDERCVSGEGVFVPNLFLLLKLTRVGFCFLLLFSHHKDFFLVHIDEGPLGLTSVGIFAWKLTVQLCTSFLCEECSTIKSRRRVAS
jgi:hypothetical protein